MTEKAELIIALDFDGVLHHYSKGWTGPIPFEEPTAGAVNFTNQLLARGYKIVIVTSRMLPEIHGKHNDVEYTERVIRDWFVYHGFAPVICEAEITATKVFAHLYIDDRGCRFDGDFDRALEYVESNPALMTWTKLDEKGTR